MLAFSKNNTNKWKTFQLNRKSFSGCNFFVIHYQHNLFSEQCVFAMKMHMKVHYQTAQTKRQKKKQNKYNQKKGE